MVFPVLLKLRQQVPANNNDFQVLGDAIVTIQEPGVPLWCPVRNQFIMTTGLYLMVPCTWCFIPYEGLGCTVSHRRGLVDSLFEMNLIEDDNPITNPFYYAQDRESWYTEVAAKACEESRANKQKEQTVKKKNKSKSLENTSYIIKRDPGRARHIVKIIIYDLDVNDSREINCSDTNSASVNVQYIIRSDYDDIMQETEYLVGKIVKKLSGPNFL